MTDFLLKLKIIACRLFANPVFILQIKNGSINKIGGELKAGFVRDCLEIANANNIKSGIVYGVKGPYNKPMINASGKYRKACCNS
jgi:hypothetical protein